MEHGRMNGKRPEDPVRRRGIARTHPCSIRISYVAKMALLILLIRRSFGHHGTESSKWNSRISSRLASPVRRNHGSASDQEPGRKIAGDRVDPLGREMPFGLLGLTGSEQLGHLPHARRQVLDPRDPVLDVLADDLPAEADLDAVIRQGGPAQRPLGVPLQVDGTRPELPLPIAGRAEDRRIKDSHVGIGLTPATDLRADIPRPRRTGGFYRCRSMAIPDQVPPLSTRGSRLAILVHQGSDPTQPYPTSVIRDRAPRFADGFAPRGQIRRCPAPGQDGHPVGSASPDPVDVTRSTSNLAKTAGRIVPNASGPAPRRLRTRASSPSNATASSWCASRGS
jgi:hypothetical protein